MNNEMSLVRRILKCLWNNERRTVLIIIAGGALVRLLLIGLIPGGLNQDEASAGYDAWALLNYGIDRNGNTLPVLFVSWGSGQNVLYSYLSMPFIALFGLNEFSVRIVAALLGTISLPIFYSLAKRIRDGLFGLCALTALAINPWHIMISRWALESNILPFFLLLGFWLLVLSREKPYYIILTAASFAVSLYAYGTAFIFVPLFLIPALSYLALKRELKLKYFLCGVALFAIIAFPITLCNLRNVMGLGPIKLLGLTLPELTETRQAATTIFGSELGFGGVIKNIQSFFMLLWTQDDGLRWNFIPVFGLFYGIPGLAIALAGVISSLYCTVRRTNNDTLMLLALTAVFCSSLFIDINVNRMNMAFILIIYFQALALYRIAAYLNQLSLRPLAYAAVAILGTLFVIKYFGDYNESLTWDFYDGLGDSIIYAETLNTDIVWITPGINAPYIFVLFYNRIPPGEFLESVHYLYPDSPFRMVSSFGKYVFYSPFSEFSNSSTAYIHRAVDSVEEKNPDAVFKHYAVTKSEGG